MAWLWFGIAIGGCIFGPLGWFGREPLTRWWKGAEQFVSDLEAQARSLRQRLR